MDIDVGDYVYIADLQRCGQVTCIIDEWLVCFLSTDDPLPWATVHIDNVERVF